MSHTSVALGAASVAFIVACGAKVPSPKNVPTTDEAPFSRAVLIGSFDDSYIAPATAKSGDDRFFAWARPDKDKKHWLIEARRLAKNSSVTASYPIGQTEEVSQLVVNSVRDHFVVAWVEGSGRRTRISVSRGEEGKSFTVAAPGHDVLWMQAVGTDAGDILVDAERTEDGAADIRAVPIGDKDAVRAVPLFLAKDAVAWQVAPIPGGFALLTIERAEGGDVLHYRTFEKGLSSKEERVLAKGASPEIDLLSAPGGLDAIFTDTSGLDPRVRRVSVAEGKGGSSSAFARSFASATKDGYLVRSEEPGEGKCMRLVNDVHHVESSSLCFSGVPEFDTQNGITFLSGLLKACDSEGVCSPTESLVTIDGNKEAIHARKVLGVETVGSIDCSGAACKALTSRSFGRSHIFEWGDLSLDEKDQKFPFEKVEGSRKTLGYAKEVHALSGAIIRPQGKTAEPWSALLEGESNSLASVVALHNFGGAIQREIVTPRAKARGGVAMTGGGRGAVVAWVGADGVHLSGLDAGAKRQSDVKVGGDALAHGVATATASDGFWVGWIDGAGEVVVRRVGKDMRVTGKEARIAEGTRNAIELVFSRTGDDAATLAAFIASDKANERGTDVDVYFCALSEASNRCSTKEQAIERTPAPAAHLSATSYRDGAFFAWIDGKLSDEHPSVVVAATDREKALSIKHLSTGALYTGIALEDPIERGKDHARSRVGLILSRATPSGLQLTGASFTSDGLSEGGALGWLSGPSGQPFLAASLEQFGLFYFEQGEVALGSATTERGRLRLQRMK